MNTPSDELIDLAAALASDPASDSPETLVWRLLCARTLVEVDPALDGIPADDLAATLSRTADYRALPADTAAYLWLARTDDNASQPLPPVN